MQVREAGRSLLVAWLGCAAAIAAPPVPVAPPDALEEAAFLPARLRLEDALGLARRHNYDVRLASSVVGERMAAAHEARAGLGPRVALNGQYTTTDEGLIEGFGAEFQPQTEAWRAGLQVSQTLFAGGANRARAHGGRWAVDAAEASARAARYDAMLAVGRAYFGAMLARDRIVVQAESVRLLDEQRALAQRRLEAEAASQYDALQAQVAWRNAQPPLARARSEYASAVEELRRLIGLPYGPGDTAATIELTTPWPFPRIDFTLEEALVAAREYRPELMALDRQRRAEEAQARAARGARWPQLGVTASYGYRTRQFGDDLNDTLEGWDVGVQGEWPLFESGALRSREAQARARVEQTALRGEAALQAIDVEVRNAYAEAQVALEILNTADAVIALAQEAARMADNRLRVGAVPQLEVLQSQFELTRARLEKAQASHDYNVAVARLYRAMGIFVSGEALPFDPAP